MRRTRSLFMLLMCLSIILSNPIKSVAAYDISYIISPMYDSAGPLCEGIAAVKKNGYFGCVDTNNKVIIPFKYDMISICMDGIIKVIKDKKEGIYDRLGNIILPVKYKSISCLNNRLFFVEENSKKYFITKEGKRSKYNYETYYMYKEGIAAVKRGGKSGYINENLDEIVPCLYDNVHEYSNGLGFVVKFEDFKAKNYIYDKKGNLVFTNDKDIKKGKYFETNTMLSFHEGLSFIDGNIIDMEGNVIGTFPKEYEVNCLAVNYGIIEVHNKGTEWGTNRNGLINKYGKVILPLEYSYISKFIDEVAMIRKKVNGEKKIGFVNKDGEIIAPTIYDDASWFHNGYAVIGVKSKVDSKIKYGVIDKKGDIIIEPQFDHIGNYYRDTRWYYSYLDDMIPISNGGTGDKIVEYSGGKWGFANTKGDIVVKPKYDMVYNFQEGLAMVIKDKKYGFIDKTGKVVVPLIYNKLSDFENGLAAYIKGKKKGYVDSKGKEYLVGEGSMCSSAPFTFQGARVSTSKRKMGFVDNPVSETVEDIKPILYREGRVTKLLLRCDTPNAKIYYEDDFTGGSISRKVSYNNEYYDAIEIRDSRDIVAVATCKGMKRSKIIEIKLTVDKDFYKILNGFLEPTKENKDTIKMEVIEKPDSEYLRVNMRNTLLLY